MSLTKRHSDPTTSLALSSRNAYLTPQEREVAAPTLHAALAEGRKSWTEGLSKAECITRACSVIQNRAAAMVQEGIEMKLDYIEMNDPKSFDVIPDAEDRAKWETEAADRPVIISGAMWVGKTRLIDNLVLGDAQSLGILMSSDV